MTIYRSMCFFLGQLDMCVDVKLQPFRNSAEKFDVIIVKGTHLDPTKDYSPFVGA